MSATGRGKTKRDPNDFYETPQWCVHRFLEKTKSRLQQGTWLEPCAGSGAIIRASKSFGVPSSFVAVELQEKFMPVLAKTKGVSRVYADNFLKWHPDEYRKFQVAIGNPPYKLAEEVIKHALEQSEQVCMLLRLNFLSSGKRCEWLQDTKPDVFVLPNRPSFTGVGTDATDYAWFLWDKNSKGIGQNKGEVSVYTNPKSKNIVSTIYDYDQDYRWLISELARPVKSPQEFEEIAGISWNNFSSMIKSYKDWQNIIKDQDDEYNAALTKMQNRVKALPQGTKPPPILQKKINRILGLKKELAAVAKNPILLGALTLIIEVGVMPGDVEEWDHWAKTADGRLILIDYGFTRDLVSLYKAA